MSIAFFDLDKTLLAENSAKLWLKAQWRMGQIEPLKMLHASYWLAKYHLGFTRMDEALSKGLSMVAGEHIDEVLKKTTDFYLSSIKNIYRPGAIEAIQHHRRCGHKTSLLTSSFDGLAFLVKNELGLDFCLCTKLEVDQQGIYTGKTLGPPCFGKNKILFAQRLCDQLNVALTRCTFYTDSASDIPLLNLVGRAVAVNPDPHLRARAQINRWEVVDWGKPLWIMKKSTL